MNCLMLSTSTFLLQCTLPEHRTVCGPNIIEIRDEQIPIVSYILKGYEDK